MSLPERQRSAHGRHDAIEQVDRAREVLQQQSHEAGEVVGLPPSGGVTLPETFRAASQDSAVKALVAYRYPNDRIAGSDGPSTAGAFDHQRARAKSPGKMTDDPSSRVGQGRLLRATAARQTALRWVTPANISVSPSPITSKLTKSRSPGSLT